MEKKQIAALAGVLHYLKEEEQKTFRETKEQQLTDVKTPVDHKTEIFKYGDYVLYQKKIKIDKDVERKIHFFSKVEPDDGVSVKLPEGYIVKVNKKTGVPYLRRKLSN